MEGSVAVVCERIDDRLKSPFVIPRQQIDRKDLKTGAQGPTLARGVAEADDLRSFVVVPSAFEKLLLGSASADGAGNAEFGHDRHRPGDARHRA